MGRNSYCINQKLRKGLWSPEEDEKLFDYITRHGVGCWSSVPKLAGETPYSNSWAFVISSVHQKHLNSQNASVLPFCRFAEMWKELQIEVDQLFKA